MRRPESRAVYLPTCVAAVAPENVPAFLPASPTTTGRGSDPSVLHSTHSTKGNPPRLAGWNGGMSLAGGWRTTGLALQT